MASDTFKTLLNNQINRKLLHLQPCQQGLQQSQYKSLTMLLSSHWITMFCQQRKNVNTASSNKGICRNPITRLWEENSSAAGQKIKQGNGSCASNNSGVLSQMERDPSTAGPSGCDQGWQSGRAQSKVSGSRIREYKQVCQAQFCWSHTVPLWVIRGINLSQHHVSNVFLKWETTKGLYRWFFILL